MNTMISKSRSSGFTLLELLLAIAILAILAAVVLSAINPIRQLSEARDSQRKNDVAEILKSVQQYFIDNKGNYPAQVPNEDMVYGVCDAMIYTDNTIGCGDLVNVAKVIPVYLSGIPMDPMASKLGADTLYRIAISKTTGVYVEAPKTEIAQGYAKTIIYVGKPPRGYVIPTIDTAVGTTTVVTFISSIPDQIWAWPEWVHELIVLIVGIAIGYILTKGAQRPKPAKKTPPSSGQ